MKKSWGRNILPPPLVFHTFKKNQSLWIVPLLLDTYFQQPSYQETVLRKKHLLLICVRPYTDFVKSTVTAWIKEVLKYSRIKISQFKSYSAKSGAT